MKKLSVLVALALLAVAGTGFAVTCAYDNVPGATLLIPYFRVSGTISSAGYIADGGTDTKISFVNVSNPGIIAHVTVWNKYSKAVLDFNVPMTGTDEVSFSMRDVLNGKLNVNNTSANPAIVPVLQKVGQKDVCGINITSGAYAPGAYIGWGQQQYLRFSHPQAGSAALDWQISVSIYNEPDAFLPYRAYVLDSLDESGDVSTFQSSHGANILDTTNPQCGLGTASLTNLTGEFSGYVTVDVVNYCTNYFPDEANFYQLDAIATAGWAAAGHTPNVLIGDVFYVDQTANSGNISGDQAIALEFDSRLNWTAAAPDTFFGRFVSALAPCEQTGGTTAPCGVNVPAAFQFGGDGREPLGDRYGFRYLNSAAAGYQTWILVWRGDTYVNESAGAPFNLCTWLSDGGPSGAGLYDTNHQLVTFTYDNDEQTYTIVTCPPGYPSPCPPGGTVSPNYVFLEASRIALLSNTQVNPGSYSGGWIDMQFRTTGYGFPDNIYNQAWVGVQHSGPGTTMNVGHSATSLNGDFACTPAIVYGPGVQVNGTAN